MAIEQKPGIRKNRLSPLSSTPNSEEFDPTTHYLSEVNEFPLLTREQEIELALKISAAKVITNDSLDGRQILEAAAKARADMTAANLRLVISIAKRYVGRGLPLLDLIQEGNLGLIKAIEEFDPNKGFRFSTYATWWIRQAITRGIADTSRAVRLPVHMHDLIIKSGRQSERIRAAHGREPALQELAVALGMDEESLAEKLRLASRTSRLDSLDRVIGDEEETPLHTMVADPTCEDPAEVAVQNDSMTRIEQILESLNPRERRLLMLRFGLDGRAPRTLEQIGQEFGVTRERIRQSEAVILKRLRQSKLLHSLR